MTDQKKPYDLPLPHAANETRAWQLVLSGLCGAPPPDDHEQDAQANHEFREHMKTFAAAGLRMCRPHYAVGRAPFILVHAYSHYWRALAAVERTWDSQVYDKTFPDGLSFRWYLAAWLHSVGIPKLGVGPDDLDAIEEATGVIAKAHQLLPMGRSELDHPSKKAA